MKDPSETYARDPKNKSALVNTDTGALKEFKEKKRLRAALNNLQIRVEKLESIIEFLLQKKD